MSSFSDVQNDIIRWSEARRIIPNSTPCALQDIDLVECMYVAYDQIKHRKGTLMPSGVFVKES